MLRPISARLTSGKVRDRTVSRSGNIGPHRNHNGRHTCRPLYSTWRVVSLAGLDLDGLGSGAFGLGDAQRQTAVLHHRLGMGSVEGIGEAKAAGEFAEIEFAQQVAVGLFAALSGLAAQGDDVFQDL